MCQFIVGTIFWNRVIYICAVIIYLRLLGQGPCKRNPYVHAHKFAHVR